MGTLLGPEGTTVPAPGGVGASGRESGEGCCFGTRHFLVHIPFWVWSVFAGWVRGFGVGGSGGGLVVG
jgi:hypothetical protein